MIDHAAGLICLTGATEGEIGRLVATGQHDKAGAVWRNIIQFLLTDSISN